MLWIFFLQRIPDKFISKYGVDLSDMAFLTIPNGTKWKVKLTKHDGEGFGFKMVGPNLQAVMV